VQGSNRFDLAAIDPQCRAGSRDWDGARQAQSTKSPVTDRWLRPRPWLPPVTIATDADIILDVGVGAAVISRIAAMSRMLLATLPAACARTVDAVHGLPSFSETLPYLWGAGTDGSMSN
jgi:hypothetical protein